MAFFEEKMILCPECGNEYPFKEWHVLDTLSDPNLKWTMLNRDMFRFRCTYCGNEFFIHHPLLYFQRESNFAIYCVADEAQENEARALFTGTFEGRVEPEEKARVIKDITSATLCRIVNDENELIEKVTMFDKHRDDRIVEMLKIYMTAEVLKNNPNLAFTNVYYYHDGLKEGLVLVNGGQTVGTVLFPENIYDSLAKKFVGQLAPMNSREYLKVDFSWANEFLLSKQ